MLSFRTSFVLFALLAIGSVAPAQAGKCKCTNGNGNGCRFKWQSKCDHCNHGYKKVLGRCFLIRVNGGWTSFTRWSQCSKSCGAGLKSRTRKCTNPKPKNGLPCIGLAKQTLPCSNGLCPVINGGWTSFTGWSQCSRTCGLGGSKSRTRTCTNPRRNGGLPCIGLAKQVMPCGMGLCPIQCTCLAGDPADSGCTRLKPLKCKACDNGHAMKGGLCVIFDCKCLKGTPADGGCTLLKPLKCKSCDNGYELKHGLCIKTIINGGWTSFTGWSQCSKTCGLGGSKSRTRTCTNPKPVGGLPCIGLAKQVMPCGIRPCPIQCTCLAGDPADSGCTLLKPLKCKACDDGYDLKHGFCIEIRKCTCLFGKPADKCLLPLQPKCKSCNKGFQLESHLCIPEQDVNKFSLETQGKKPRSFVEDMHSRTWRTDPSMDGCFSKEDKDDYLRGRRKKVKWSGADGFPPHLHDGKLGIVGLLAGNLLGVVNPPGPYSHSFIDIFGIDSLLALGVDVVENSVIPKDFKTLSDYPVPKERNIKGVPSSFDDKCMALSNPDDWFADKAFGADRFVGVNPILVTRANEEEVFDALGNGASRSRLLNKLNAAISHAREQLDMSADAATDYWTEAAESGDVLVINYEQLDMNKGHLKKKYPNGNDHNDFKAGKKGMIWMPAPIAVFILLNDHPMPILIQTDQTLANAPPQGSYGDEDPGFETVDVANPDFEAKDIGDKDYSYETPVGWTGKGGIVLAKNGNQPWGELNSGSSTYYLAIQHSGSWIKQQVQVTHGEIYILRYKVAARPGYGANKKIRVTVDGMELAAFMPSETGFQNMRHEFLVPGGSSGKVTVMFKNVSPPGDCTVFVDVISINRDRLIPNENDQSQGHAVLLFSDNPDRWLWRWAKTVVQSADVRHHEIGSHLVWGHLMMEPFIVATQRQLHFSHPVYVLLADHFHKTEAVNRGARQLLVPTFLTALGFPEAYQRAVAKQFWQDYDLKEFQLPNELASRGFQTTRDPQTGAYSPVDIPATYKYAHRGLEFHNIISAMVKRVLDEAYGTDAEVQGDAYLQAWAADIMDHCSGEFHLSGFPDLMGPGALKKLTKLVTHVIWTATGYHSAVNFNQHNDIGYIPFKPLATYLPYEKESKNGILHNLLGTGGSTTVAEMPDTWTEEDMVRHMHNTASITAVQESLVDVLTTWDVAPYPISGWMGWEAHRFLTFYEDKQNKDTHPEYQKHRVLLQSYLDSVEIARAQFKTLSQSVQSCAVPYFVLDPDFCTASIEH